MKPHPHDRDFELRLLGGFDARFKGISLGGFSYNKMRALLAYLAIEPVQDHSREVLAALLWSDNDAVTARGNLRRTLSDLRRALELPTGKVLFSTSKHTIRFIPEIDIDVVHFTRQTPHLDEEELTALYRGEFLAGFSLPDSPDFESWLQLQRANLQRRALTLLDKLSNTHEQAGDYARALQFALRYSLLEPWNEDGQRRAMRCYALSGQNSAAIAQYDAYSQSLLKEHGVLPDEKTRQLAERIRNGERLIPSERRSAEQGGKNSHTTPRTEADETDSGKPASSRVMAPPSEKRKQYSDRRQQLAAGRRQVTVLHCELSVETSDPDEEEIDLLRMPQARCIEIIRQLGGHPIQTHGGGLLAYFGYPQAHEDAARRAVQAALALKLEVTDSIHISFGVHTGMIITSTDIFMPDTAGKISKLAIQLSQNMGAGEVAISQITHQLVGGYFNCHKLDAQAIRGFKALKDIYIVAASNGARTRMEDATQLSPLVGRHAELAELMKFWDEAAQGANHVVLIQADAGMGKSRLLHTLKERLADIPHVIRELRCFPVFSHSPFYPLIALLEVLFDFASDDIPELKSAKLAALLEAHCPASVQETVPLLSKLLSLPPTSHYPAPVLSPKKIRERTIAILLELLQALSAQQPVLLIVEDLHWIDPSTLELLTLFIEQNRKGAILTLLTARTEFDPPWNTELESPLALKPLIKSEVAELIASIRGDIPAATLRLIVERADGVPLFAEEMARLVDSQASLPATLHDLLTARIDSLGEAKLTAQLAACIGREFNLNLLSKVAAVSSSTLMRNMKALEDAGLILQVNEANWRFKHALIQESAYQSQTRDGIRTAHTGIAQALISDYPDIVALQPEIIAQHFKLGGDARQAIEYWLCAAERTAAYSACAEVVEYLQAGLDALGSLPEGIEKDRLEFALQLRYGFAMQTNQGYGANTTVQAFYKAIELSKKIGNTPGLFHALLGLNSGISSHPDFSNTTGLAIARQLVGIAQQSGDPHLLQQAYYSLGSATFWMGDFAVSRLHHEQSISLDPPNPKDIKLDYTGMISSVMSQSFLSWILWFQGFPEQAQKISQLSIARARQFATPHTLAFALTYASSLQGRLRNIDATLALAEEGILLAQKMESTLFLLSNMLRQGWCLSMQGKAEGLAQLRQCIERLRIAMGGIIIAFNSVFAEALLHHGQAGEALKIVDESLIEGEKKNDHHFEAELNRLKGEALLQLSRSAEAEICFERALQISREQGAKSLELRATMSMTRLSPESRFLLERIYNEFTEGFDTVELQQAAKLLRLTA
jgi:DNA-binding SARP family transcriptional activator/tetratricopeptide (TPR) repeat protein